MLLTALGIESATSYFEAWPVGLYWALGFAGALVVAASMQLVNDGTGFSALRMGLRFSRAVRHGQVSLAYQPVVSVQSGRAIAAEALIRWNHPRKGQIAPVEFVSILESSRFGERLDAFVLEQAAEQATVLRAAGIRLPIAVNLSPARFLDPELPRKIAELRRRWDLDPGDLQVELTERALDAGDRPELNVEGLAAQGVEVALDDFGVGYSALQRLVRLPLKTLKIDRSFVGQMHANERAAVVVRSAVELAHALELQVTAEGVENEDAWRRLDELGVDSAQGFGISRPLSAAQLTRWLSGNESFEFEADGVEDPLGAAAVNGRERGRGAAESRPLAPAPLARRPEPVASA